MSFPSAGNNLLFILYANNLLDLTNYDLFLCYNFCLKIYPSRFLFETILLTKPPFVCCPQEPAGPQRYARACQWLQPTLVVHRTPKYLELRNFDTVQLGLENWLSLIWDFKNPTISPSDERQLVSIKKHNNIEQETELK